MIYAKRISIFHSYIYHINGVKKTTHTEYQQQQQQNHDKREKNTIYMCIMDGDGNVSMESRLLFLFYATRNRREQQHILPHIIYFSDFIHTSENITDTYLSILFTVKIHLLVTTWLHKSLLTTFFHSHFFFFK